MLSIFTGRCKRHNGGRFCSHPLKSVPSVQSFSQSLRRARAAVSNLTSASPLHERRDAHRVHMAAVRGNADVSRPISIVVVPYDPVQISSAMAPINRSRASLTRPISQYRHRCATIKGSLPNGQLLFLELSAHSSSCRETVLILL